MTAISHYFYVSVRRTHLEEEREVAENAAW
jgi:hypothetical protein